MTFLDTLKWAKGKFLGAIKIIDERYRGWMETPIACKQCQKIFMRQDLQPRLSFSSSSDPFKSWIRQKKGFFHRDHCPDCWKTFLSSCDREYHLMTFYKREYNCVERHNERAQEKGRTANLTIEEWLETLEYYNWKCAYCKTGPYEALEHHIPLCHPDGETSAKNCVPACHSCNRRKGGRHPDEIIYIETSLSPQAQIRVQSDLKLLNLKRTQPQEING